MKDIQLYIDKLNIVTGKNYRLPTEAEWEFAARGGVKSNNYRFSGSNSADSVSWEIGNAQNSLHPVGIKKPNELGIYDMSGNVREWCADYYTSYKKGYHINPKGKTAGSVYTIRGGSWKDTGTLGRVSCRGSAAPDSRENNIGFRLVLDAEESVPVKATFQYTVNNLTSE